MTMWPVYTLGQHMNNQKYTMERNEYIEAEIEATDGYANITVPRFCPIIPKDAQVERVNNIFSTSKTKDVAEAYLKLASKILGARPTNTLARRMAGSV